MKNIKISFPRSLLFLTLPGGLALRGAGPLCCCAGPTRVSQRHWEDRLAQEPGTKDPQYPFRLRPDDGVDLRPRIGRHGRPYAEGPGED